MDLQSTLLLYSFLSLGVLLHSCFLRSFKTTCAAQRSTSTRHISLSFNEPAESTSSSRISVPCYQRIMSPKKTRQRMSEQEVKARHIGSEHSRRAKIAKELLKIVAMVPGLEEKDAKAPAKVMAAFTAFAKEVQEDIARMEVLIPGGHSLALPDQFKLPNIEDEEGNQLMSTLPKPAKKYTRKSKQSSTGGHSLAPSDQLKLPNIEGEKDNQLKSTMPKKARQNNRKSKQSSTCAPEIRSSTSVNNMAQLHESLFPTKSMREPGTSTTPKRDNVDFYHNLASALQWELNPGNGSEIAPVAPAQDANQSRNSPMMNLQSSTESPLGKPNPMQYPDCGIGDAGSDVHFADHDQQTNIIYSNDVMDEMPLDPALFRTTYEVASQDRVQKDSGNHFYQ